MCEHCGCLAVEAVAALTDEHGLALSAVRDVELGLARGDLSAARRAGAALLTVLAVHTAVEEHALFPAMHAEFPSQLDDLVGEHRLVEQSLADLAAAERLDDGLTVRVLNGMTCLRNHIRKEEDGVFPAALSVLRPSDWERLDVVRAAARHECAPTVASDPKSA